MYKYLIFIGLVFFALILGCQNGEDSAAIGKNGKKIPGSELRVLMVQLYEEGFDLKKAVSEGKLPKSHIDYNKILGAKSTEPGKSSTPEYAAYSETYFKQMANLLNSDKSNLKENYTKMIQSCMGCHQAMCPGPMVKIKKLYLD